MDKIQEIIEVVSEELKKALIIQKECEGGMDEYIQDLEDSSTFYNEAQAKGQVNANICVLEKLFAMLEKEVILNDYLYYMGYYGHCEEEDKETNKLNVIELAAYTVEKRSELIEEEIEDIDSLEEYQELKLINAIAEYTNEEEGRIESMYLNNTDEEQIENFRSDLSYENKYEILFAYDSYRERKGHKSE